MLELFDKKGKLKFIWFDGDTAPTPVDELSIEDQERFKKHEKEEVDGLSSKSTGS